jgi:hypothetical protein
VAVILSLKFMLLCGWKRWKEAPMTTAFVFGVRSALETIWAIGASYVAAALPG